ncbi:mannose-P-dolichol utilization defect 1 protein homolog [Onthophagus taurus]|uniref:mannose-P-dolichol utilization defect 1 protein homolog n=1 Tax=Onthophagus taurus TaxID=166361 RepID=UPI000C20F38D|nr:mannose-P-dolichol utilization defect 1 protein homolog [Onthophagus taurus]
MDLIKQGILLAMTPQCFDEYFVKFNFLDVGCFKSTLSKCLGIGIILGSVLVKLPQILKIIKNKSGQGINILSVTLDLCAITIALSYNYVKRFPFTSWGDATFLALQTSLIGALALFYAGKQVQSILYLILYGVLLFILAGGPTSIDILWTLQGFNIPILLVGKLAQAYTNWKNGSTGQLSAITLFLLFFGSVARIFTSIQETGDSMVIITYCFSSFANGVILFQLLYYWNVDDQKKKIEKKKKK